MLTLVTACIIAKIGGIFWEKNTVCNNRLQEGSGLIYEDGPTVGSHLSELQLSEHVGYPNAFSKATPTISGYLCRVSGLALPVVWQLKTQDNFYGQARLRNEGESNCQSHPLGTASLPQEMETEQRLMVVRIQVNTTYTVSGSSLADP